MDRCAILFGDTADESVSYVNMSGLVYKLENYTFYAFESLYVSSSMLFACLEAIYYGLLITIIITFQFWGTSAD